jgi:hypothetical protein
VVASAKGPPSEAIESYKKILLSPDSLVDQSDEHIPFEILTIRDLMVK